MILLFYSLGEKPNVLQGTRAVRPLHPNQKHFPKDPTQWGVILTQNNGDNIVLHIRIPAHVQVGIWNIQILSNIVGQKQPRNEFKVSSKIIMNLKNTTDIYPFSDS